MAPALADGQWVLVIRGSSRVSSGDVGVYRSPEDGSLVVKRCILTEDDPVVIENGWLVAGETRWYLTGPQNAVLSEWERVPEDGFFFVGDNQFRSLDSREYGFVDRNRVVGRVLLPEGR